MKDFKYKHFKTFMRGIIRFYTYTTKGERVKDRESHLTSVISVCTRNIIVLMIKKVII